MDELGNVDCRRTAEESTPSRDPSHPFTPAVGALPRRRRASPHGERPGRRPRRGKGSPNPVKTPSPSQGRDAATAAVVLHATARVFHPGASVGARLPPPSRPSWRMVRNAGQRQCPLAHGKDANKVPSRRDHQTSPGHTPRRRSYCVSPSDDSFSRSGSLRVRLRPCLQLAGAPGQGRSPIHEASNRTIDFSHRRQGSSLLGHHLRHYRARFVVRTQRGGAHSHTPGGHSVFRGSTC